MSAPKQEVEISDPFVVLGIAPTLDLAEVKRGYFAVLALHPPHKDAAAFQRIRAAYEQLRHPSKLTAAYLSSSVDLATELRMCEAVLSEPLRLAGESAKEHLEKTGRRARFLETLEKLSFAQAMARR